MYIAYFDESGDDGFPNYSSDIFVLTSLYVNSSVWKDVFNSIYNFRKLLKLEYDFQVILEFHTKDFIMNKNPYKNFNYTPDIRREIVFKKFNFLSTLDVKIINVVINKNKLLQRYKNYSILENALKYNVQRIENDIKINGKETRFIIISDEGRIGKMIKITRKIQSTNLIPSKIHKGQYYRSEIQRLIEDPLPKSSKNSYFIQFVDMVAFIVNLYMRHKILKSKNWRSRVLEVLSYGDEEKLLDSIIKVLNLKANPNNKYGIVFSPK